MRHLLLLAPLLLAPLQATHAQATVSLGVALPGVSIGIQMSNYPELQRVPGYPVYYAPGAQSNYFFYDGLYWVYQGDDWYSSGWYNGPWQGVSRDLVPVYLLRVPVRYYRQPPAYFQAWSGDAPPRWGERWGGGWQQRREGWDRWNPRTAPAPAPLPSYQGKYPQSRYPQDLRQQEAIRSEQYRYQPRDPVARQQAQPQPPGMAPRPQEPVRTAPAPLPAPARNPPPDELSRGRPPQPGMPADIDRTVRPPVAMPPGQERRSDRAEPPGRGPDRRDAPGRSQDDRRDERRDERDLERRNGR